MRSDAPLLERATVLDQVGVLVRDACRGEGHVLVVEGAVGMGKSRLVLAARELAGQHDMHVITALGDRLQRGFAYGVVRQLFEPVVLTAPPQERASLLSGAAHLAAEPLGLATAGEGRPEPGLRPTEGESSFPSMHGLYWLCANLAARHPLMICIDDAQWADTASLRFLAYLARRVGELPVLCVLATSGEEPSAEPILAEIVSELVCETIRLGPLSAHAATSLVRGGLGEHAEAEFGAACHRATGGNPYLLAELVLSLQASGLPPTAANANLVSDLGPATVSRLILQRLRHVSEGAVALAEAIAVLGPDATLAHAAALAGVDPDQAAAAADALVAQEVLAPADPAGDGHSLRFVHSIVRNSVYASLRPADRARRHARAAAMLRDEGALPERVGTHLLVALPEHQPWVVDALRDVARQAVARGSPEAATTALRRALSEPPAPEVRGDLLYELGVSEARIGAPEAAEHLREAVELSRDAETRMARTYQLAQVLVLTQPAEEAGALMAEVLRSLPAEDTTTRHAMEANFVLMAQAGGAAYAESLTRLTALADTLAGDGPAERMLLAAVATASFAGPGSAEVTARLATTAYGDGLLLREQSSESLAVYQVAWTLVQADRAELAQRILDEALEEARSRGSLLGFGMASSMRAYLHCRFGSLAEAEADASEALGALTWPQWLSRPLLVSVMVDVLVERGDLTTAMALVLQHNLDGAVPETPPFHELLASRIRLRLAMGDVAGALDDATELERQRDAGLVGPLGVAVASLTLLAAGQRDEALLRAERNLAQARAWGAPTAVGKALRAAGLVEGGDAGLALLEESAAVLERSPARLERARALVDLGAQLRRRGQKMAAREPLRQGLHLATEAGGQALAERALYELRAAGARPRQRALTGLDALTATERRVAEMAAAGKGNRDIAEALFVTTRTIEGHLTHAYQKLGITSRAELVTALHRSKDVGSSASSTRHPPPPADQPDA